MFDCGFTEEQLKKYGTGCGSKSHWLSRWFRLPRFVSESLYRKCSKHDVLYSITNSKEAKLFADQELVDDIFYSAYKESSNIVEKYLKILFAEIVDKLLQTEISNYCYYKATEKGK